MDELPLELLMNILGFIPPFSLDWSRLQRVCKKWHWAAQQTEVFRGHLLDLKKLLPCLGHPQRQHFLAYARKLEIYKVRYTQLVIIDNLYIFYFI